MPRIEWIGDHPFRQIRVTLADGRRLLGAEYGHPGPLPPILYFHGFTGSRMEPRIAVPDGVHLIAFDRPGYGGSQPMPALSLRAFGREMAEVVQAMGLERVAILGISAGGPYAVAAAVELGPRALRLALVAAVAGKKAIRLQGGAVRLFRVLRKRGRAVLTLAPGILRHVRRRGLERTLMSILLRGESKLLAPGIDRHVLLHGMAASWRESTRGGLGGALADMELLTRRWDLSPAEVTIPCLLLHGALDRVVPLPHSLWYARRIPHARLLLREHAGHLSVAVNEAGLVADWLAGRA